MQNLSTIGSVTLLNFHVTIFVSLKNSTININIHLSVLVSFIINIYKLKKKLFIKYFSSSHSLQNLFSNTYEGKY